MIKPINLYLDDAGIWAKAGHWKIIKFQPDTGDHPNTRNMIPMSISDDPQIMIKNPKIAISSNQIEEVKTFIKNNKDLLLQLADAKISILDFGRLMKK